jgi:anti-anti-sigma regulatory factor
MPALLSTGSPGSNAPTRSNETNAGNRLRLRTDWPSAAVVRISAAGEVDASNHEELARYVFRHGANSRRLIVDLSDVDFFGVECFSTLRLIGQRCVIAEVAWTLVPSPAVTRVARICDPQRALPSRGLIAKQPPKE